MRQTYALAPFALFLPCTATLFAQDEGPVGESLVTARKWEEALQDVPGSISVVDAEDIRIGGWDELRDVAETVPNLNLTEFSSRRLSFPFVRGIGSGQGDPSVITYIDGVPQFGSGGVNLPLLGVERIEFLRGPQGTLYGRNALGGVMHILTERPSPEFEYSASAAAGTFDRRRITASASGPSVDSGPLWGLDAVYDERDGFTDNTFTGNDVDYRRGLFARGELLFTPDSDSELRLTMNADRSRDGGFVLGDLPTLKASPHKITQDFEGVAQRDLLSPALTWTRFGSDVDFVSITALQHWEVLETSDFDFSFIDGVRRRTEEKQNYVYQELRASSAESPGEENDEARWLVGLSGFLSNAERSAANEFRPAGAGIFFPPGSVGTVTDSGDFSDYGVGAFGQVTLPVGDKLEVTGGLRWDYESKDADLRNTFASGGFTLLDVASGVDENYDELVPHVSAAYHLTDDAQVYALASRGFKAGGFNLTAPTAPQIEFGPETSWTYEVGTKVELLDGKASVGFAAFAIDWEDMQLSQFDFATGGYVQNVGESNSKGIEVEVEVEPFEDLTLFSGFGLADTEFDQFVDPFLVDVSGNSLPFAPETTWSVGALFTRELSEDTQLFLRGDFTLVGDFYYDAGNLGKESYGLTDLRVGMQRGGLGVSFDLRNAFDEEFFPVAFQPDPTDNTAFVGETGAPRTVLLTISYGS